MPSSSPDTVAQTAPKRIYFVSLGCPKNQVDTEVMLGQVTGAGHALVQSPEEADVIVVNTCAFIDAAKEESVDTILEMAQHKSAGTCAQLVVTGCLSQRYPDELATEIPEIDHILGSADFAGIAAAISLTPGAASKPGRGKRKPLPVVKVSQIPEYIYDHASPRVTIGPRHSTYVKIAEGCDRPCSFCIIPKLRGPQRSRTIDSVVAEVTALVAAGAREINLIAQDLTRYGADLPGGVGEDAATVDAGRRPDLAQLLRRVARVPDVRWVRLHYGYPSAFTDELIDVIADEPTVVPYVDVPLQHIDEQMLKTMRRGHSARVTHELLRRLRSRIDGLVLRTTFIVGHPGESDDAFERLYDFVGESEFDRMGAFTYSIEPGTVSAMLPHRVDPAVAVARRDRLMALQQTINRRKNEALIGRELEVLVDGVSDESEYLLSGRWYGQAPGIDGLVYLADGTAAPGDLVRARVTQAADYDLAASMI